MLFATFCFVIFFLLVYVLKIAFKYIRTTHLQIFLICIYIKLKVEYNEKMYFHIIILLHTWFKIYHLILIKMCFLIIPVNNCFRLSSFQPSSDLFYYRFFWSLIMNFGVFSMRNVWNTLKFTKNTPKKPYFWYIRTLSVQIWSKWGFWVANYEFQDPVC